MKKLFGLCLGLLLLAGSAYSQNYRTSVGVRGAFASGITVKHFVEENAALEGILNLGVWGAGITGLYEIHAPAFDVPRLYWFYGFGGHISQWNDDFPGVDTKTGNYFVLGIDGIIGMEYDIEEIPFTIGVDWKPTFNLVGFPGFLGYGGAVSVRYKF